MRHWVHICTLNNGTVTVNYHVLSDTYQVQHQQTLEYVTLAAKDVYMLTHHVAEHTAMSAGGMEKLVDNGTITRCTPGDDGGEHY